MAIAKVRVLRKRPRLLITESVEEFETLRSSFRNEIEPRNAIERLYTDEFSQLVWEIRRWRRSKVARLNLAFRDALYLVLVEQLAALDGGQETVRNLDEWFTNPETKKEVRNLLAQYGLDESALEAEAFRQCSNDLMLIEQLLATAETRRDKALQTIAFYRQSLANMLRETAAHVIGNDSIARIEPKRKAAEG